MYHTALFIVLNGLGLFVGLFAGFYLYRWYGTVKKTVDVTWQRLNGTYRDPSVYEVKVGSNTYRVRNISEIPEEDRATVKRAFEPRARWMNRFLTGSDAIEPEPKEGLH